MAVCALVGAAPFNEECFRVRHDQGAFACVIAVDGGFASLQEVGCTPDVAMGDFDSLGYVPRDARACMEVLEFPAQKNESDMELALGLAQERGFDEVEVYGAIGGRLDHTLANLQLFASFCERGLRVTAVDLAEADARVVKGTVLMTTSAERQVEQDGSPADAVIRTVPLTTPIGTALTFLTGPAELRLEPYPGQTVSVFSLSDEALDVTETGLVYPLDHVTLTNRTSRGLSNEFTDAPAVISVASGTLVVFHPLF